MRIRSARLSVPAKWCFSAALATNDGKKVNPAATSCAFAKFAWIVTRTHCWCVWKPWGPAFAMRDTEAAFFARSGQMGEQKLSPNGLSLPKQCTERRRADEFAETGNPKRQPTGSDA